ncbi:hypothetical protein, partial [Janthinobacterium sp. UMAB-56]|uniref:hypothetical protein n=1 Tax=Janthinobacterium sp. UMAB-56 TaxID=1365361 RepID=UPI001C55B385
MADYFYDGMPNVNERLNLLYTAFAAGPYNALPLTGGTLTGPVSSNSRISTTADVVANSGIILGNPGEDGISSFRSPMFGTSTAGVAQDVLSMGVAGIPGQAFPGRFVWDTSSGNGSLYAAGYALRLKSYDAGTTSSTTVLVINGSGGITSAGIIVAPVCQFGPIPRTGNECVIAGVAQSQGQPNVRIPNSATFFVTAGASGSSAPCALNVGADTTSGRGINVGGTINASGADYAEYLTKGLLCGTIFPGQIVGIDADGRVTDTWDRAIAFMVKSTNPCMVGGDSWAQSLGARPVAPTRAQTSVEQELITPAVPADEASGVEAVAAVYRT